MLLESCGDRYVVAIGRVVYISDMHHGLKLKDHLVKVVVETPVEKDAKLPQPTEECETVFQALGSFIEWPKNLIDFDIEVYSCLLINKVLTLFTCN